MSNFFLYVKTLYFITDFFKIVKIGVTDDLLKRKSNYNTNEFISGYYTQVYSITYNGKRCKFDKKLKKLMISYNRVAYNEFQQKGGTEFYTVDVLKKLDEYIKKINNVITYKLLTDNEIKTINSEKNSEDKSGSEDKSDSEDELDNEDGSDNEDELDNDITIYNPFNYQQDVLSNIKVFYEHNDIGKLIWACGLGKSLMTLFIIKEMDFKTNLICVPSKTLQKQWKKSILSLFPEKENLLFVGGDSFDGIISTNNIDNILTFITKDDNKKFIVSTYHLCNLFTSNTIVFDFKIGDEAHHLVGLDDKETTGFKKFHKIKSKKTLFMTATEKVIESKSENPIYTMDDKIIFGDYIDIKSVHWAIENKKITDYNILVIKNTNSEVDSIIKELKLEVNDKNIFLACYMCLKALEKYKNLSHLLLYTNKTNEAEQAKKYINDILSLNILNINKDNIYNNALHSNNTNKNFEDELTLFKNSEYGIISCVYIFGEGFDLPKINGVCIASNMTSIIRIIQYLLRANRLEKGNISKIAYQIIPCIDDDNKSYENVRHIIHNMRTVDENIEQKIKLIIGYQKANTRNGYNFEYNDFQDNIKELIKLKMRLRYSKTLNSDFSKEEDEYNYVRSININLNINSDTDYILNKSNHEYFIENPESYFKLKGVWINHYHFYGIDTSKFILTKTEWITFCKNKSIKNLEQYYDACRIYSELPENPAYLYNNFSNIENELKLNNNRRR